MILTAFMKVYVDSLMLEPYNLTIRMAMVNKITNGLKVLAEH